MVKGTSRQEQLDKLINKNMELMDHLAWTARWLLIYCEKNNIKPPNVDTLLEQIKRCRALVKQIALSDEYLQHNESDEDFTEPARDNIHINNCENKANLLKIWLSKFMGINKYNLNLYVKTFQFIHNIKSLNSFEKFMKILSVLVIISLATRFGIMSVIYF